MNGAFEKHGLTIHEACIYSGIGKTKLYEAINSGKLKAHKAGKTNPDPLRRPARLPLLATSDGTRGRGVVIVDTTYRPLFRTLVSGPLGE